MVDFSKLKSLQDCEREIKTSKECKEILDRLIMSKSNFNFRDVLLAYRLGWHDKSLWYKEHNLTR